MREYAKPEVNDYGDLQEITANNEFATFADVPQGTSIEFSGSEPPPEMS
jgi:hypothetical protein